MVKDSVEPQISTYVEAIFEEANMGYSVITEQWIPVTYKTGEKKDVSLNELFKEAHLIYSISDEYEMTNLGIIRLLCVIYMDAYRPETKKDREMELIKESFDMDTFDSYVKQCEKIGNCFDLFDEKVPFLQTGDISMQSESCPVSRISNFEPSGTEITFYNGQNENSYCFSPKDCAKRLCQKMTTVIKMQGQGFLTFNPLLNAIFMLNKGNNLKETIVLNSLSKNEWLSTETIFKYGTESGMLGPSWRQGEKKYIKKERIYPELSLLSMMTFMSENIKLIQEDDGYIRRTFYTGKKYKDDKEEKKNKKEKSEDPLTKYYDPMVMHEEGPKEMKLVSNLDPSIGLWSMIDALYTKVGKKIIRPYVLPSNSNEIITVETWSPCKNGKGKGIVYHDEFNINTNILDGISVEEVANSSESFVSIIQGFKTTGIKHAFLVLNKGDKKHKNISEIQKLFRLYMNMTYFPVYIKNLNEMKDESPIEIALYRKAYKKDVLDAFENIAIKYLTRFPNDFRYLKAKQKCIKEIKNYFNKIRNK